MTNTIAASLSYFNRIDFTCCACMIPSLHVPLCRQDHIATTNRNPSLPTSICEICESQCLFVFCVDQAPTSSVVSGLRIWGPFLTMVKGLAAVNPVRRSITGAEQSGCGAAEATRTRVSGVTLRGGQLCGFGSRLGPGICERCGRILITRPDHFDLCTSCWKGLCPDCGETCPLCFGSYCAGFCQCGCQVDLLPVEARDYVAPTPVAQPVQTAPGTYTAVPVTSAVAPDSAPVMLDSTARGLLIWRSVMLQSGFCLCEPADIHVAGTPCIAWSTFGRRSGASGPTLLCFMVWVYQRPRDRDEQT